MINSLRRDYRDGKITLELVQDMIKDQPIVIQRLILPEPPPTTQQCQSHEQQQLIDDEEQLATRLKLLQIHMERELDEALNEATTAQHQHESASTETRVEPDVPQLGSAIQHELSRPMQTRQLNSPAENQIQQETDLHKRTSKLCIAMFGMPPTWTPQPWQQQQSLPSIIRLPGHQLHRQLNNIEQQQQNRPNARSSIIQPIIPANMDQKHTTPAEPRGNSKHLPAQPILPPRSRHKQENTIEEQQLISPGQAHQTWQQQQQSLQRRHPPPRQQQGQLGNTQQQQIWSETIAMQNRPGQHWEAERGAPQQSPKNQTANPENNCIKRTSLSVTNSICTYSPPQPARSPLTRRQQQVTQLRTTQQQEIHPAVKRRRQLEPLEPLVQPDHSAECTEKLHQSPLATMHMQREQTGVLCANIGRWPNCASLPGLQRQGQPEGTQQQQRIWSGTTALHGRPGQLPESELVTPQLLMIQSEITESKCTKCATITVPNKKCTHIPVQPIRFPLARQQRADQPGIIQQQLTHPAAKRRRQSEPGDLFPIKLDHGTEGLMRKHTPTAAAEEHTAAATNPARNHNDAQAARPAQRR
ncbi:uncharacterized protein Dvir_GJ25601 [Drosophila virilis]|uniref:Uncharacterized protein n=2 Tax=Drosophila virilis TaxID=7244 RepID=A0A0Q9WK40_DROVI|nr:uncharacterized protein LOC26530371 [Drosophila virilis]KRF80917.1 uncharacterized protein Dvir_GJ25601 [Drosophila virilis]